MITKWAGKDSSKTYNHFHLADLIENERPLEEKKGTLDETTVTKHWLDARQHDVPQLDRDQKPPLSTLMNLNDFENAFYKHGPAKPVAYMSGASNDLLSLSANTQFWQKLWFRPRVMRNVKDVNTKMTMLGVDVTMPVRICPMGAAKTAGPESETALGVGAKANGIVYCMSTLASSGVEDISRARRNIRSSSSSILIGSTGRWRRYCIDYS